MVIANEISKLTLAHLSEITTGSPNSEAIVPLGASDSIPSARCGRRHTAIDWRDINSRGGNIQSGAAIESSKICPTGIAHEATIRGGNKTSICLKCKPAIRLRRRGESLRWVHLRCTPRKHEQKKTHPGTAAEEFGEQQARVRFVVIPPLMTGDALVFLQHVRNPDGDHKDPENCKGVPVHG